MSLHAYKPIILAVKTGQPLYGKGLYTKKALIAESLILLAVRTRLELATPCVTGMYSNQLNYRTIFILLKISPSQMRLQKYDKFSNWQNFFVIIFVYDYFLVFYYCIFFECFCNFGALSRISVVYFGVFYGQNDLFFLLLCWQLLGGHLSSVMHMDRGNGAIGKDKGVAGGDNKGWTHLARFTLYRPSRHWEGLV